MLVSQALANPASVNTLAHSDSIPAARMLKAFFYRPKPTIT